MKIKTYISNVVAALTLVALVSGFQVKSAEVEVLSTEKGIGIEEAYAGPCERRGCDGEPVYCTSYYIVEIGNGGIIRHCEGTPLEEDEQLPELE